MSSKNKTQRNPDGTIDYVERLSPEEEAAIPGWIDKWFKIGVDTNPVTPEEYERWKAAIKKVYALSNRPEPMAFYTVDSATAGVAFAAAVEVAACQLNKGKSVDDVGREVQEYLTRSGHEDENGVFHNYSRYTLDVLDIAQKCRAADFELGRSFDTAVNDYNDGVVGGQFWVSWAAYGSFWHDLVRLRTGQEEAERAFRETHLTCSWWIPAPWGAVHVNRPDRLCYIRAANSNEVNRPHSEDGPAVRYRDGRSCFLVEGMTVPRILVMEPEKITVEMIDQQQNAEIRRLMMRKYGMSRYFVDSGSTLLDADYEGATEGAAPRALIRDNRGQVWMFGTDGSTSRPYHMPVDPGVTTCREAHESICGYSDSNIYKKS